MISLGMLTVYINNRKYGDIYIVVGEHYVGYVRRLKNAHFAPFEILVIYWSS